MAELRFHASAPGPSSLGQPSGTIDFQSVDRHMLGTGQNDKIVWRVVERVLINMVNVLIRPEFTPKKLLHYQTVLWFVVTLANHDISVSVLNVDPSKDFGSDRRAISTSERVVVCAKPFCNHLQVAPVHQAPCVFVDTTHSLDNGGIAVLVLPFVVHPAHAKVLCDPVAAVDFACFHNRHSVSNIGTSING